MPWQFLCLGNRNGERLREVMQGAATSELTQTTERKAEAMSTVKKALSFPSLLFILVKKRNISGSFGINSSISSVL